MAGVIEVIWGERNGEIFCYGTRQPRSHQIWPDGQWTFLHDVIRHRDGKQNLDPSGKSPDSSVNTLVSRTPCSVLPAMRSIVRSRCSAEPGLGGYQVIKNWLSYRESAVLGRGLKPDETAYVSEIVR